LKIHFALVFSMLLVTLFSLLTSSTAKAGIGYPVYRLPGVKAGDWAKYAFRYNYSSTDPNSQMPPNPLEDIDYYKVEVLSVEGTNVTSDDVVHFPNGTEIRSPPVTFDVSSGWLTMGGQGSFTDTWSFIGANLTAGDQIYLNPSSGTINTTVTGTYASSQREANCFQRIDQYRQQHQRWALSHDIYTDHYWDRLSGIILSANRTEIINETRPELFEIKNYITRIDVNLMITETNIWKPTPAITVRAFVHPQVINVKSQGKYIIVIVELPKNYKAKDIDLSTITLNGTIKPEGRPMIIGKRWLMIKFDRGEVIDLILKKAHPGTRLMRVQLTITGILPNGETFQGTDRVYCLLLPSRHCRAQPY